MKNLIIAIVILAFSSNVVFAADSCDWTKIKKLPDGNYEYPLNLHLCVGKLVEDSKVKDQQVQELNRAISLKDLAIKDSDARANQWLNTSMKLESNLNEVDKLQKGNDLIYFGLGIATTVIAIWGASQVINH